MKSTIQTATIVGVILACYAVSLALWLVVGDRELMPGEVN